MSTQSPGLIFYEEQRFRQLWLRTVIAFELLVTWGLAAWFLLDRFVLNRPLSGSRPLPDSGVLVLAALLIIAGAVLAGLFWLLRLQVRVDEAGVRVRFWPLPERIIRYGEIMRCYVRTYRPIREYGGWGVRWSWSRGRAYNVSGSQGVQLELSGGKRVLLGTQQPERLEAAICSHLPGEITRE